MANGQQNPGLTFQELYEQGRQSVPIVESVGGSMVADLQRQNPALFQSINFETGPLKEFDRANAKVEGDYKGDHTKIADLARGRLVVDTPEQVRAVQEYLTQNRERLGIETLKDNFAEPNNSHYRGINMKFRLPNGHIAEMQVVQRDMIDVAKKTHKPYEDIQAIERTATAEQRLLTPEEAFQRQKLLDQVRDIHDGPARALGLDTLLNDKGRTEFAAHTADRVTPRTDYAHLLDTGANPRPAHASPPVAEVDGLGHKAGKVLGHLGAIGGIAAVGYFSLLGEFAQAAEQIPFVPAVTAAFQGRFTESALSLAEETGVGLLATEALRPALQSRGVDVNSGLIQSGLAALSSGPNAEQDRFNSIYESLPSKVTPDMPPEIASLVEMKAAIEKGETTLSTLGMETGTFDNNLMIRKSSAEQDLSRMQERYTTQYDAIQRSGNLSYVTDYLQGRTENAPSRTADASTPSPSVPRPAQALGL